MKREQIEDFRKKVSELVVLFNNLCEIRRPGGVAEIFCNIDTDDDIIEIYEKTCHDCIFCKYAINECMVEYLDIITLNNILNE